jgi:N utilization substance protein A
VTGVVQADRDSRTVRVDLGALEAIMPPAEQVPDETYRHGERAPGLRGRRTPRAQGPQVVVSRTHPNLVQRLFKMEVPEIESGVVEIKALAREAGYRSKIAVTSHDPNVSAKGACIGPMGQRVRA